MLHDLNTTTLSTEEIAERFRKFAARHIATWPDLQQQTRFPADLWEEMRQHHLFGIGIRQEYEGQYERCSENQAGPYRLLAVAGNAMAASGGNLGVCLSWLIHELTALWLVQSVGTEDQKAAWLPRLAQGESTACLAISEPGVGAHPKHLATSAEAVSDGFRLNGEKTYLTNAPLADLFIVVAVTGNIAGKKQFTAFLVPKTAPGLTLSPSLDFPFLRPSPHGGIVLKDCMAQSGQVLGTFGRAYEDLVLPFRTVEDTLMMGPIAGGLAGILRHLIARLNHDPIIPDESLITATARLHCATESLATIARTAAGELDAGGRNEKLTSLGLFFRNQAGECLHLVRGIMEKRGVSPDPILSSMMNDLSAAIRIAENVSRIKLQRLGQGLFAKPAGQEPL